MFKLKQLLQMPRNSGGTYSLPASNPVSSGTTIESAWANDTMGDLANEMTDSLSRTGDGGMLAPLKNVDGAEGAPSYTFLNGLTTGMYFDDPSDELRFSVNADDKMVIGPDGVVVPGGISDSAGNVRAGRKNYIINGNCLVAQYGDTFGLSATTPVYGGCDQILANVAGFTGLTFSVVQNDTGQPGVRSTTGFVQQISIAAGTPSGTPVARFIMRIEAANAARLANKQVTFSCNLFHSGGTISGGVVSLNKTNVKDDFSAVSFIAGDNFNIGADATTPFSFTHTFNATDAENGLQISIEYTDVQVGALFQAGDLQLEEGSVKTDMEVIQKAQVLDECMRYYIKYDNTAPNAGAGALCSGVMYTATDGYLVFVFPTKMRVPPSVVFSSQDCMALLTGGGTDKITSAVSANSLTTTDMRIIAVVVGGTQGHGAIARFNGASRFIELKAEL